MLIFTVAVILEQSSAIGCRIVAQGAGRKVVCKGVYPSQTHVDILLSQNISASSSYLYSHSCHRCYALSFSNLNSDSPTLTGRLLCILSSLYTQDLQLLRHLRL